MSERLNAVEVVAELRAEAGEYAALQKSNDRYKGIAAGYGWSADFVEQHLVPQWQAEPTGECVCYIKGCFDALFSIERTGNGRFVAFALGDDSGECIELNGRPICPISGPPSDEKGGA